jgi:hypothetical protein
MSETELAPLPPARVKRKYRRRVVAKPAVDRPFRNGGSVHDDEFAGLSLRSCATACNVDKCVISGDFVCTHPQMSGGLQALHLTRPEVMARYDRARSLLESMALGQRQQRRTTQNG